MEAKDILKQLELLDSYLIRENYAGYDPYDVLNSKFNPLRFGKYAAAILTQVQKRNPVNLRPLLMVDKGHNPKGMGLFLTAYAKLYATTGNEHFLKQADWLFNWLFWNFLGI